VSIASGILANAPTAYWKLDDATASSAADSSGNGNPGHYVGAVSVGQPGPEAGTLAALFDAAGGVLSNAGTPRSALPFSLVAWVATLAVQTPPNVIIYNGSSNARGAGLTWATGTPTSNAIALLRGGVGIGGAVGSIPVGAWHQVAQTWDAAGNVNELVDGVSLIAGPAPFNAIASGDPLVVGAAQFTGQLVYIAHAALFPVQLTTAQVLAQFTANAGLVTPPAASSCAGLGPMLDLIYKAVHQSFP
jgi:hypothetical protein